jgi:hypothetical protein
MSANLSCGLRSIIALFNATGFEDQSTVWIAVDWVLVVAEFPHVGYFPTQRRLIA